MQKVMIALLIFCSIEPAYAHFQGPMEIKEIVYQERNRIQITVGNDSLEKKEFQMYIDGMKSGKAFVLGSSQDKKVPLFFRLGRDEKRVFDVCSIARSFSNHGIRTRICTSVKLLYPYSRLQLQN